MPLPTNIAKIADIGKILVLLLKDITDLAYLKCRPIRIYVEVGGKGSIPAFHQDGVVIDGSSFRLCNSLLNIAVLIYPNLNSNLVRGLCMPLGTPAWLLPHWSEKTGSAGVYYDAANFAGKGLTYKGIAARGFVNGRGPRRRRGRDLPLLKNPPILAPNAHFLVLTAISGFHPTRGC